MVSAAVQRGAARVKAIRFSLDPEDGWWILAEQDLPMPDADNLATVCVHCVVDALGREVAAGMDAAKADAEQAANGVGVAVRQDGSWATGEAAWQTFMLERLEASNRR